MPQRTATQPGLEPGTPWSVVRNANHCASPPSPVPVPIFMLLKVIYLFTEIMFTVLMGKLLINQTEQLNFEQVLRARLGTKLLGSVFFTVLFMYQPLETPVPTVPCNADTANAGI